MTVKNLPGCLEIPLEETRSGHYTWNLVPEEPPLDGEKDGPKVETSEISLFLNEMTACGQREACKVPETRWNESDVQLLDRLKSLG